MRRQTSSCISLADPTSLVRDVTKSARCRTEPLLAYTRLFKGMNDALFSPPPREAPMLVAWAALYPSPETPREPNWGMLGGGLRRILQKLGLAQSVTADAVLTSLR